MKALVYTNKKFLEYKTVQNPRITEDDVLIKIESVGICGSDMHAFLGHDDRRPAPLILGHEAAGVIVEGENSGKRVTVNPLVSCGECSACKRGRNNICPSRQLISIPPREGAFAEFLVIPKTNVLEVPENVDINHATIEFQSVLPPNISSTNIRTMLKNSDDVRSQVSAEVFSLISS